MQNLNYPGYEMYPSRSKAIESGTLKSFTENNCLMVSGIRNPSLAGWSWLRGPQEVAVEMLVGMPSSESLTRAEGSTSKVT